MGLRWQLRVVYPWTPWAPYMSKYFRSQKTVQSIGCIMVVFRKFDGLSIKYVIGNPERKRRILHKNPFKGKGWRTPQKTSHIKITHLGSRNPWTDCYQILHVGFCPWCNQACRFWWRLVEWFWCGYGSNFWLFDWRAWSPLQHSRTTMWVCDKKVHKCRLALAEAMIGPSTQTTSMWKKLSTVGKQSSVYVYTWMAGSVYFAPWFVPICHLQKWWYHPKTFDISISQLCADIT